MDSNLGGRTALGTSGGGWRKSTIAAAWTDNHLGRRSTTGYAELERQRYDTGELDKTGRFLTWAERQRLVDAPSSAVWPLLLAIGMLAMVSMTLRAPDKDADFIKGLDEAPSFAYVPDEENELPRQAKELDMDADSESDPLLLLKKRELISMDEGGKSLDWVEKPVTLGEILFKPSDRKVLLTQAPSDLAPVVQSIMKQATEAKQRVPGHSKISVLLQQDLVAVAELILLCRILAANGTLNQEQTARLKDLLNLAGMRFGKDWPEALSLTRYFADARERNMYLRLVSLISEAVQATGRYFLADFKHGKDAAQLKESLSWKLVTSRFEIERLLEAAKLPVDISEVFRAD